jgi:hypothetical protein
MRLIYVGLTLLAHPVGSTPLAQYPRENCNYFDGQPTGFVAVYFVKFTELIYGRSLFALHRIRHRL